jgi:NADH-quinone oxidoreductase subunit F
MKILDSGMLEQLRHAGMKKLLPTVPKISVGMGTCGLGNNAQEVFNLFKKTVKERNASINVTMTGCFGFCAEEALVNCYIPGMPLVILARVTTKDVENIVTNLMKGVMPVKKALCKIEKWNFFTSKIEFGAGLPGVPLWNEIPFFKGQKKIVLRNAGLINPEDIEGAHANVPR